MIEIATGHEADGQGAPRGGPGTQPRVRPARRGRRAKGARPMSGPGAAARCCDGSSAASLRLVGSPAAAGARRRASAGQLHDQPLRRPAGRSPTAIALDVVIDQAEIPTFQESTRIDTNGDGTLSAAEIEAERLAACPRLAADLSLSAGPAPLALTPIAAGLSFPVGRSGVATMRLVCEFAAALPCAADRGATKIRFEDRSWRRPDRLARDRRRRATARRLRRSLPATSISKRLTTYPADLLAQPLDIRSAAFTVAARRRARCRPGRRPTRRRWLGRRRAGHGIVAPAPACGVAPARPGGRARRCCGRDLRACWARPI